MEKINDKHQSTNSGNSENTELNRQQQAALNHIICKLQETKRKEKIFFRERFCYLLRNKERKHAAKKRWNEIFRELRERDKKCRIQYSVKLSFKSE